MNLPEVFYTPLPLSKLLDTPIALPSLTTIKRKQRRRRFRHSRRSHEMKNSANQKTEQFVLEGLVHAGTNTRFSIDGNDFAITPTTWIIGEIKLGAQARVKGTLGIDGYQATSVVMITTTVN
jgi:hypothetical protein